MKLPGFQEPPDSFQLFVPLKLFLFCFVLQASSCFFKGHTMFNSQVIEFIILDRDGLMGECKTTWKKRKRKKKTEKWENQDRSLKIPFYDFVFPPLRQFTFKCLLILL